MILGGWELERERLGERGGREGLRECVSVCVYVHTHVPVCGCMGGRGDSVRYTTHY